MSASSIGLPPQIEQQLVSLDKQLRDAAFIRGMGRLIFGTCFILGSSLFLDSALDLNGSIRGVLLTGWILIGTLLLWRCLVRPILQAPSFPALAALIEQRHPELRERLTSLVELQGYEESSFAPGTSKLMQELLARQTVKVFDRLDVGQILPTDRSFRSLFAGMAALLLLFVPFWFNPDGYGLLWSRFFVPWGNFAWGATVELKVWEGDQTIARGADATVHVSIVKRRMNRNDDQDHSKTLLLNWRDEKGVSDSRRLEWDPENEQYVVTLSHVMRSLTFQVTTEGAKSGTYAVDVSDPPSVTRLLLQIEPAAYTGLPAKSMEGVPGELKVPEFSKLYLNIEFNQPVASAELSWPTVQLEEPKVVKGPDQPQIVLQTIPLVLSQDFRSGKVEVVASGTGPFVIRAKNDHGLQNDDPARSLLVIPDLPPQIQIEGDGEPILVRPDEVAEIEVDVLDDYGLTAVELHAETSTEIKHIQRLTAQELRDSQIHHRFDLDLAPFGLGGGQVVTYRIRSVDNRPTPNPQEVWSSPRMLMTNTSLKQIPDKELANAERSLEDELTKLRTDVNQAKADLSDLHRKTEDESLGKQGESDKNEKLEQLRQAQEKLVEQLEQFAHKLAERGMTQNLADQARQIADENLKTAENKVQQAKDQPARDQLEPLAQAIDHLGNADRQLGQLDQQLNELNKLEQDLAELSRMAQRAERMANQLEKLDPNQQTKATEPSAESNRAEGQESQKSNDAVSQNEAAASQKDSEKEPDQSVGKTEIAANSQTKPEDGQKPPGDSAAERQLQQLKDESQKLTDQLNELLKKHPEILEAARKDQIDQLNQLAEQAKDLGEHQSRLAQSLQKSADEASTKETPPENGQAAQNDSGQNSDQPDGRPAMNPQQQRGSEAAQKQDQIARSAIQQAADLTKETGADTDATKSAAEFARKADAAREQAQSGDLKSAAQQAEQAAKAADDTAQKLDTEGTSNSPQSAQAKQLANQQQKVAEQLKELAGSKEAAQGAQMQGQKQLAEQFPQTADTQKSAPLNLPRDAETGEKAKQIAQNDSAPATVSNPKNQAGDKPSSEPSSNSASGPQSKPKSSDSKQAGSDESQDTPAKSNQPSSMATDKKEEGLAQNSDQPNDGPATNPQQQRGSEAAQKQDQLARSATKQALDLIKETGTDSDATKSAAEFARKADAAREQAQSGDLKSAAQQAEQAAKAADDTAQKLDPEGTSNSPQSAQAKQLANQQQKVAEQLKELAGSKEAAQGAQMQGQKQLSEATKRLAEQFQQTADTLKSAPLNLPKNAETGEKAKQAAQNAEKAMNESEQANRQNEPAQAAKSASEAVEKLKEAADAVKPSDSKPSATPVSRQIAKPVAEAVKQMETAQQKLSQCNCQNPTASGQNGSPKAGQAGSKVASNDSSAKPGQNPSQQESQSANAGASKSKDGESTQPKPSDSDSPSSNQGSPKPGAQPGRSAEAGEKSNQVAMEQGASKPGEKSADPAAGNESPKEGSAKGSENGPSQFSQAANQFRSVAALLKQARGELSEHPSTGQQMAKTQPSGQQLPDKEGEMAEAGDTGNVQNRAAMVPDLRQLDAEILQQNQQNWGRLPGQLRTEILQGAGKKSHSEYKQRIKAYFDEISKPSK